MDANLIDRYAKNFFGYGCWSHKTWFVGMEEGGGNSPDELNLRANSWLMHDKDGLIDDPKAHGKNFGHDKWYMPKAPLQRTVAKLILVYLSFRGLPTNNEALRQFQVNQFGRLVGDFASLELFPFPARTTNDWVYSDYSSKLPYLINRDTYTHYLYSFRADALRQRIKIHKPKRVVFYGRSYMELWAGVIGQNFESTDIDGVSYVSRDGVLFVVIHHPVARNVSANYWPMVGQFLCHHS